MFYSPHNIPAMLLSVYAGALPRHAGTVDLQLGMNRTKWNKPGTFSHQISVYFGSSGCSTWSQLEANPDMGVLKQHCML